MCVFALRQQVGKSFQEHCEGLGFRCYVEGGGTCSIFLRCALLSFLKVWNKFSCNFISAVFQLCLLFYHIHLSCNSMGNFSRWEKQQFVRCIDSSPLPQTSYDPFISHVDLSLRVYRSLSGKTF